ncbi:MAG: dihydroorotate dehydrogenase electron transfer subunit [Candidatus Brocadiaceae bacterium]|nr:dihydroorotate dehydrogenase electron transfer subunit [Candidatus Brocadiaceae bacterium]
MIEQPRMINICDVWEETPDTKTFFFPFEGPFTPGQFFMIWIPLLDEKPFTISYIQEEFLGITVLKRGIFTQKFHEKKAGDSIGIRGPYGKGFELQTDLRSCLIGGGIGMASLATIVDRLHNVTIIQGAKTSSELLYRKRFQDMNLCTDDGTLGYTGTTVDVLNALLEKQRFQKIYACGPERMMYKISEICKKHDIEYEASLERYIKCGFGVCGQCDCSGQRTCIDGPVFHQQELIRMADFGKISITKTGERVIHP